MHCVTLLDRFVGRGIHKYLKREARLSDNLWDLHDVRQFTGYCHLRHQPGARMQALISLISPCTTYPTAIQWSQKPISTAQKLPTPCLRATREKKYQQWTKQSLLSVCRLLFSCLGFKLNTAVSGALSAAKKVTDVLDGSGTSAVADGGGVEAGTRAATQAYSTEEMGVSTEFASIGVNMV